MIDSNERESTRFQCLLNEDSSMKRNKDIENKKKLIQVEYALLRMFVLFDCVHVFLCLLRFSVARLDSLAGLGFG